MIEAEFCCEKVSERNYLYICLNTLPFLNLRLCALLSVYIDNVNHWHKTRRFLPLFGTRLADSYHCFCFWFLVTLICTMERVVAKIGRSPGMVH
jgi:hypothetical protein